MLHAPLRSEQEQAGTKFAERSAQMRQALTGAVCRTPHQLTDAQSGALPTGPSSLSTVRDWYSLGVICSLSRTALSCAFVVQHTLAA